MGLPVAIELVCAVFDRLVPRDAYPNASDAGIVDWLDANADGDHARIWAVLTPGFAALDRTAGTRFGGPFVTLSTAEQDDVLRAYDADGGARVLGAAAWLAAEGYYARPGPGWDMVGYRAGPARAPHGERRHAQVTTRGLSDTDDSYDIVVIGAGAGGGVSACVLSEAGARVLLVER